LSGSIASTEDQIQSFIRRWENSGSAERANYNMFLTELCVLLGVPVPNPSRPDDRDNAYVFERSTPLFEEERHVCFHATIADLACPLRLHRPSAGARFSTRNNPVNSL
jgi:hypothetical protein